MLYIQTSDCNTFFPSVNRIVSMYQYSTCFFCTNLVILYVYTLHILVSWTDTINKMFVSFAAVVCFKCLLAYTHLFHPFGALIRFGVCASPCCCFSVLMNENHVHKNYLPLCCCFFYLSSFIAVRVYFSLSLLFYVCVFMQWLRQHTTHWNKNGC